MGRQQLIMLSIWCVRLIALVVAAGLLLQAAFIALIPMSDNSSIVPHLRLGAMVIGALAALTVLVRLFERCVRSGAAPVRRTTEHGAEG